MWKEEREACSKGDKEEEGEREEDTERGRKGERGWEKRRREGRREGRKEEGGRGRGGIYSTTQSTATHTTRAHRSDKVFSVVGHSHLR